ncbi:hypothetical protein [Micromonospora sp. DH14]|uniref:hypothetical protein n=1 Tax=Micromonospora sp. DH14 TaxID=3040120 RepID=UPI002441810C|nr:hypothetical protein [Micromonospora sp. DH14]MDG9678082.1 hypothetical protein [Micromonospora sp. DH14]
MTSRPPQRKRAKRTLLAVSVTVGLLSCLWVMRFLWLQVFHTEGALPPMSRVPQVPAGATVTDESMECASGGCWRTITVVPAAGQSPQDLAREMGLTQEQTLPPTLLDPMSVYLGAKPKDGELVLHLGYR